MVPPLLTSLDVDAWALAFAAFVTLVSVALAGLSAAHVTQWDRANDDEDSGWVVAFAERAKQRVESTYPRLTKALSSSPKPNDNYSINRSDSCTSSTKVFSSSFASPPRRR